MFGKERLNGLYKFIRFLDLFLRTKDLDSLRKLEEVLFLFLQILLKVRVEEQTVNSQTSLV